MDSEKRKHRIILIKYFSIPIAPEYLRAKWIDVIERANGKPFNGYGRICNLHFVEEDYEVRSDRFILGKNVYPKIFESPIQDVINFPNDALECAANVCSSCETLEVENQRLKICLKNLQIVSKHEKAEFERRMKSVLDENHENSNQISIMKMKIAALEKTTIRLKENALRKSKVFLLPLIIYRPEFLILIFKYLGTQK